MMSKIIKVYPLDNYYVHILFSDGLQADIDIKPFIGGGISEELKDKAFFDNVFVDEFGGVGWKNGYDFCPNFLRELIEQEAKAA